MKEEERIFKGILFSPGDPELRAIKLRAHNLSSQYSLTLEHETDTRAELLSQLLGHFGKTVLSRGRCFSITAYIPKSGITFLATLT